MAYVHFNLVAPPFSQEFEMEKETEYKPVFVQGWRVDLIVICIKQVWEGNYYYILLLLLYIILYSPVCTYEQL